MKRIIAVICILVSSILFVGGISVLSHAGGSKEPEYGSMGETNPSENIGISIGKPLVADRKPVNMLVLGVDEEEVRADVIMLLNYSPETGKINILSISRDTRVRVRNKIEKINALMGIGGEEMLVKGIEQITGLPVKYYIRLNFEGFRQIIDALGGVEVYVPMNMLYNDPVQNLHINLKKGRQMLDGAKAEQYVRYRKGNKAGQGYIDGDIGRNRAQQQLVRDLIDQKLKIKYISKAQEIYSILKEQMKTNIKASDLTYYIRDLHKVDYNNIRTFTTPGESKFIKGIWYFVCDLDELHSLIDKYFY